MLLKYCWRQTLTLMCKIRWVIWHWQYQTWCIIYCTLHSTCAHWLIMMFFVIKFAQLEGGLYCYYLMLSLYAVLVSVANVLSIWFQRSQTALMVAAKNGNVGIVRKLIQHGASLKLTNKVNQASFQTICTETQQVQSLHACSLDDKVGWWWLSTFQHPCYHEHLKSIKVTRLLPVILLLSAWYAYTALMNRNSSI